MKTFSQLNETEQAAAFTKCLNNLLKEICEGAIRFNDDANKDDLQKRIDKAWEQAERMQTPWFVDEYIMDTCREELESMAYADAENALYSEPGENVINGIAA